MGIPGAQFGKRRRRPGRSQQRLLIEALEARVLLTGANEQALLNAIDAALQPGSSGGLTAFNSLLKGSTALGTNLPVVGTGLSAYDPGAALGTLLNRLSTATNAYTSVAGLVTALQNGAGVTVTSSSDLLNNIELAVQFTTTSNISVPLNPNYGVTFVDPGTLTMSTTLSENLTIGAYWDANTSAAVFYVNANNDAIQITSTVTTFTFSPSPTVGQLGFLEFDTPTTAGAIANISGNRILSTTVSFSPTLTFSLNDQPPLDSAEAAGRLTLSQLTSVPIATLVNTQLAQASAATVTANISTPLDSSAKQIVFTWSDINAPATVTSTLPTDPTLAVLNQLQTITPSVISAGLDETTGDLTAAATNNTGPTTPFSTNLPLINESVDQLVNFLGSSSSTSFYATYLTNTTDPTVNSLGNSVEPFSTDSQFLGLLTNLYMNTSGNVTVDKTASSLTETAKGSELIFTLDLDVIIDSSTTISLNVQPALNLSPLPQIYVQTAVNTQLSFGVNGSTGEFFVVAGTTPTMQVNVGTSLLPLYDQQSNSITETVDLGSLGVNLTNATFQLAADGTVALFDPMTDNPPTPGIITADELESGLQPSGTVLPVPATVGLSGTASAVIPMSVYNLNIPGLGSATANISWANVGSPSTYTYNSASLGQYLGFSTLNSNALLSALLEVPTVLNSLSDNTQLGRNLAFFGTNLGATVTLESLFNTDAASLSTDTDGIAFQNLIDQLQEGFGGNDISLNSTSDGVEIGITLGQQYNNNVNWMVSHPIPTTSTYLAASGSVPITATYSATLDFGIVLTAAATAANQFYLLGGTGGSSFSGNLTVNARGINGPATVGNLSSVTIDNGTATVAGTSGGVLEPGTPATISVPFGSGSAGQRLTLGPTLANPDSFYGTMAVNGGVSLVLPLSGLPAPGMNPQVVFAWSSLSSPSSITVTPTNLGTLTSANTFASAPIANGLGSLLTLVGTWQNSPVLGTNLFLINQTADQVINFEGDFQTALQSLKTSATGAASATALDNAIKNTSLASGVTIVPTSNDAPGSNDFEYTVNFNINKPINATLPFNFNSGLDSNSQQLNVSLETNLPVTASFVGSLTFGFDPGDGFYVYGGTGSPGAMVNVQVSTSATFPNQTMGMFGSLPFGVSGGTASMSSEVGLTLMAPGDNGEKISSMELANGGMSLVQNTITGTGAINLPFGVQLGMNGPGVISSFSADWNPTRAQPVEYGSSDAMNLAGGFGEVDFDYTEFVTDMVGPLLQQIENYDPIPPQVLSALNYNIPIINMTPAQILESEGDYSDNDDLSTLLSILSVIGEMPSSGSTQVNLSQYLPGVTGTAGDFGAPDGDTGNPEFSAFQDFIKNDLEADTGGLFTLPAFDNTQASIINSLLGQDVTLIEFNTGKFNLTASTDPITILPSTPVLDLGFASVNLSITAGASISLMGDIDIGLSTRGLLGVGLLNSAGPDLLDGIFFNDNVGVSFGGSAGLQQIALEVEAHATITGSLDLGGFLSVASISGSLGPYGEIGVRVNSLVPNATNTGFVKDPQGFYEIAGYNGDPAGNGMAYLDEIAYIANTYSLTCAVMPDAQLGLQLTISATIGDPPLGFSFTVLSQQFPIVNFDFPCQPVSATLAQVSGNQLIISPNFSGYNSSGNGTNTISASVLYSTNNSNQPIGIAITESTSGTILYQDIPYSQLAGVNTLVMNGTEGDDTFNFDPNLTLPTITVQNYQNMPVTTPNPVPIEYLDINTLDGNDKAKLNNLTTMNSDLLGLTIDGGNGNDFFEGNYAPSMITLGNGSNTVVIGTGNGEVVESGGQDIISGGDGNNTVKGGSGSAEITLGNGNNVIQESNGSAQIVLGNGKNLVTDSTLSYASGIASNGSSILGGAPNAPQGSQAGFIEGNSSIAQFVNGFVPTNSVSNGTALYAISFTAAEAGNNPGSEEIQVLLNGKVIDTVDPTSTYQVYTTPTFSVSDSSQLITFQGLDATNGPNTALIGGVQVDIPLGAGYLAPTIADNEFQTPAIPAGTFITNDTSPSPDDQNPIEAALDQLISSSGWTFIAGIGTDSVVAGNGANTINGDAGGSTIFVGDGQDIISASGSGANFINAGGLGGQDSSKAGGGNDFIQITPSANGTYTVNGGSGKTLLDVLASGNIVLNNQSVNINPTSSTPASVQFTNIATVSLSGESGSGDSFDVSAWTGAPVNITGGSGNDTVISTDDTNFTLTDNSLARSDGTSFALSGVGTADLTGGASDNSFDVTGWHGGGVINGNTGNDSVIVGGLTSATLSNTLLQRTGASNLTLSGIEQANLTTVVDGGADVNASAFTGDVALFGQGNNSTLLGGSGSDYIVGGPGTGNMLVGNGTTDNQIMGGAGSGDHIQGGAGENLLVSSSGGGDVITTGSGPSHIYTPGKNNTINAQGGNAIVYNGSTGNTVNTGSSTTDQVVTPGEAGTVPSDFTAPATTDLWEFPASPVLATATLPTGTAELGQWVEYGTSASGGGVSSSTASAIEPSIVATGSGASAVQYVAWADDRTGTYEIYVARESSSGWAEIDGSAHGGGVSDSTVNSTNPSIGLDSSGNPIVAWVEAGDVFLADYNPTANGGAGGWVGLGDSLSSGGLSQSGGHVNGTIVLTNEQNQPVLGWKFTNSSGVSNVYAKIFNGTAWVALGTGAASGLGISNSMVSVPNFAMASNGTDVTVAWTQPGTSAGLSVYLLQYNGSTWSALDGSASGTGISGADAAQMPSVAYVSGTIYAAWAANTDGTDNIVAASSTGASWTPISIQTPTSAGVNQVSRGVASDPVLSANGSSLDLVWVEDRLPNTPDQAVAIYANRLMSGSFVDQLPGDSSFDGILGRPTSLSQPATVALSVDSAGHPFVTWGDSSSGSDQVYMLGDTLNVNQIIYVNDFLTAEDSYTTAAGSPSNTGLAPNVPLASIQAALNLATIAPGDVILVDSGSYNGFTAGAADNGVLIIGSPDGTTDITGAVSVNGAQNMTLQSLDLAGGATLTSDTNIELHNDIGGPANQLSHSEGGSVSIAASSGVTLNNDALVGVTLNGSASANVNLINNLLPGTGLTISSGVSGLVANNNILESLNIDGSAQGLIADNNISGRGGVTIGAAFTGSITGNFIHGANVGVTYNVAASLNANQIFGNRTGVVVSAGSGLGFLAGSSPNDIVDNGTGVNLLGTMQGQYISHNDIGVSGSGVLGGSSLTTANQIEDNTTGVNFNGTVQYNRIDYNGDSIVVQNGQLIAHNLFYDNNGQNLQTLGASNVEIFNNSFYSPNQTNIFVNSTATSTSSDVEIINNILWTGGGYDLDIDNASRTGYFSDYNDLYTTGAGLIVHYLVDFSDILDWQDDVALYDLHSIGTTVVNPTATQPQFVNLGFGDFNVFPAAAGLRKTSPTIATGDPETDLALPASTYVNQIQNPSFNSGTTDWTVNPGGTSQSSNPTGFEGNSYFFSGAVASGFAQQTVSLLSAGYTAAAIDAGDLDISFGGRIRSSAADSIASQGQLLLTFLDGSGNVIGTPTLVSASNVTDRWELVGGRVHVPVGARSVTYRFQTLRESGSTDDSYMDAAFLYVVADTIATDIGAYGASNDSVEEPVDEKIQLQTPDLYVNWTLTQSHNILWSTFGNTGDAPVEIDLYQNGAFLLNITPSTPDDGVYAWIPQDSGLSYGTFGLQIKVSLVGDAAITDTSTEKFAIPQNSTTFYINDGSTVGDQYTTAAGNNRATGAVASAPLPLLTTLLRTYSLGAEDTVYVDNGTYFDFAAVELSGNPAIGSGQGVTIIGPTLAGDSATINALGFTSPAVIDVNDASFVSISHIGVADGNYGIWLHNGSSNFTGLDLTATDNLLSGIRIEADSSSATTLNGIVADGNTGDGVYAGGPIVNLINSTSFNNTGDGFDFADSGAALLTDDIAYNNANGLVVGNSTSGTTTTVGNANLTLGLGNQFYDNATYGIYAATGSILLAGNTVYGQTAKNDDGIDLGNNGTATENVVYDNYVGIVTGGGTVTYNNVYGNSNVGIEGDSGATLTGNVADQNGIGIQSFSAPNSSSGPYLSNNLVYNNSTAGIALYGGNGAQFYNNTVYQVSAGNAITVNPDGSLNSSNISIENNILWTQDGYDLAISPNSSSGFKSDYNDLYVTGTGQVGQWQNFAEPTLQAWQDASATDADSLSSDPLFVSVATGDFHVQSTTGSFHGGSLAPVVGSNMLPVFPTATLTADASESPTIDRGDPSFSFANEPSPNGGFINLGSTGDTAQASLSPTSYVLVLKPIGGSTLIEGQNFTITWRSQDTGGTANIELLENGSPAATIATGVPNSGTFVWTIPTNLSAGGGYTISVTRNTTAATGVSGAFTISTPINAYYVNASSTGGVFTTAGGSDSNSGLSPSSPKATIQALLSEYTIGASSIIYVDTGTYNLTSNIVLTAANSGITIEGVPGGGSVINRGDDNAGAYDFDLQGVTGATIENLTIGGAYYGINALYTNGLTTDMTVSGCTFVGNYDAGINLANNNTTTGDVITGNTFVSSAPEPTIQNNSFAANPGPYGATDKYQGPFSPYPWSASNGAEFVTPGTPIDGLGQGAVIPNQGEVSQTITGWGAGSYELNIGAAQAPGGSNQNFEVLIDNTVVGVITPTSTTFNTYTTSAFIVPAGTHTITVEGLDTAGGSNTALINAVTFVGLPTNADGVTTQGAGFTLSNNIAFNLNYGFYITSADGSTITGNTAYGDNVGFSVSGATMSGNIAYNDTTGIAFSGTTLSGNTSYDNTAVGINLSGGTASGNVVYGNPTGIEFTGDATASDNLVYNNTNYGITGGNGSNILGNVLYGNGTGISTSSNPSAADGGPKIENNLVYNNTNGIVLSSGDVTPVLNNTIYQTGGIGLEMTNTTANQVAIRDNIIWDIGGTDLEVSALAEPGVAIDYNDLYATGGGQIGVWGTAPATTLANWQAVSGMDPDSISADPLFVNAAGGDFHVQSTTGSFHGGSLAPTLNTATELPIPASPGTLTADASESPTIDRGLATDPYSNEPAPNGAYVNLGSYGNTSQASLSPAHFLFVINPSGAQTVATGQPFTITWRDEVSNTSTGASDKVIIDILLAGNTTPVQTFTEPDVGSYTWTVPTTLAAGTYQVSITRTDGTGLTATSNSFPVAGFTGIYYVNGSATGGVFTTAGGSVSNSGLDPAHPKLTIAAILAAYTLQPGNIIMVDEGTYNLSTNITLTVADSGITIEGVAGLTILNRGDLNAGGYVFDIQDATNVTLKNLNVTGALYGVNANYGEIDTGLTVTGCNFYANENVGVYLEGNNGSATITNNTFSDPLGSNSLYGFESYTGTQVTVTGNTADGFDYGLYVSTSGSSTGNSTISNNTVYGNNIGIGAGNGSNGLFSVNDNIAYDNYDYNLDISGTGLTATGNTIYQDGGAGKNESSSEIGAVISVNAVLSGNNVYGNVYGVDLAGAGTVSGNNIHNNSSSGVEDTADTGTISGNTIDSNGAWGVIGNPASVLSNLIYGNTSGGIYFSGDYDAQAIGNTVYQTTGPAFRLDGLRQNGGTPPSITLQNNIFWTTSAPALLIDDAGEDSFSTPSNNDYNDIYATGTGEIAEMGGENFASLSAFAFELGLNIDGISANPQFVNAANGDFHVLSTSPTIDAGNPASEFIAEPNPNGGRVNLGYDGDTAQAAPSPSATSVQVTEPTSLQDLQVGQPYTIQWISTGVLATQTLTEVAPGESSTPVGEYHANEFEVGTGTFGNTDGTAVNTSGVVNPAPQAVYQNYIYDASGVGNDLSYLIPVPNGTYTIRLDWADPGINGVNTPTAREFDVLLQGKVVQSAYSVFAAAGDANDKAVELTFTVTATGGTGISLELNNDTTNPAFLNGFEISEANAGGTANPTANVQVSTNNGSTWSTIATNQPFDVEGHGSYVWTPTTQTAGATALIRVVANTTAATTGTSQPFLIANSGNSFYVNGNPSSGGTYTTAGGNNLNSGKSPNAPMASIEAVINTYHPGAGDTIYVDGGTYNLFHDIDIAVQDSGLTIQGPTSGTPAVLNRGNTADNVIYLTPEVIGVTLDYLSITGGVYGVYAPLEENPPVATSNIKIENDQIYANEDAGILTGETYNWTITGNVIHDNFAVDASYQAGIYLQSCTGTVTDNTVYNEPQEGIYYGAPVSGALLSTNVISGNTVYADGTGIDAGDVYVTDNVAHDNTSFGIDAGSGSVVTGNTVYRQTATNAVGIETTGGFVSDNQVFGNYLGIVSGGTSTINGNRVYSNANYGLVLESENGSNYTDGPDYVATAYNNIVYANATGGISITGATYDLGLFNNTVYQLIGDAINVSSSTTSTYPLSIENNILWVEAGYDLDIATAAQPGLMSNYNILYHMGASARVGTWNGTPESTLAAWQAASAQDANSSEANPDFVDPAGADAVLGYNATANNGNGYNGGTDDDFSLMEGSPAIDSGASWVGPATDIDGAARYDDPATPDTGSPDYYPAVQSSSLFNPTSGTAKNWNSGTPEAFSLTLPFTFSFYGTNYTSVFVSTTGVIGLGTSGALQTAAASSANSDAALLANPLIAPLWGNLETNQTGDNIFVNTSVANQVTIRWAATNVANGAPVNFDVILYSNGQIQFDYGAGNTGLTPTVGISKGDGQHDKLTTYDGQSTLTNADSVLYSLAPGYVDMGAYEFRGTGAEFVPPTITSANNTAFAFGQFDSFLVTTAYGFPTGTSLTETGNLPAGVTFMDNGNGTATISGIPLTAGTTGSYSLTLTATSSGGLHSSQPFTLVLDQAPTITSLASATFTAGQSGSFTVTTSPGFPAAQTLTETGALPSGVTFKDNGNGTATISGTPALTAGGIYALTITATSGQGASALSSTQSFALTVIVPLNLSANIEYVRLDADGVHADIWNNLTASGAPAQSVLLSSITTLIYNGPAGGDTVILDFTHGDPLPSAGIALTGGAGQNTLQIIGSAAAGQVAINGGSFTIPAGPAGGGTVTYTVGSVSIAAGASLVLAPSDFVADQTIFTVNVLSLAGTLDVTDNALAIDYAPGASPLATVRSELASGYNSGAWNGAGIISSFVAASAGKYGLAYFDGSVDTGSPAKPGQVLVEYTLVGDTNLDYTVNLTDLLALLNNYGETGKNWSQGDFNYDGTVNLTDLLALLNTYGQAAITGPQVVNTLTDPATSATGTLSLREAIANADSGSGSATIDFAAGLTGTINLASSLPAITRSLTINGPGTGELTVTAPGSASILTINSGVIAKIENLTIASGSAQQTDLTIVAGGTLDIGNGSLALDYVGNSSPLKTIQSELASGYDGGAWNGTGIISSAAATNSSYAVGYADGGVDSGTAAQPGQVLLKYTLVGDANLDGVVNLTDLLAQLNSYGQSGKDWASGDFNYDGAVNLTDLLALLNNYGQSAMLTAAAAPVASNQSNIATAPSLLGGAGNDTIAGGINSDSLSSPDSLDLTSGDDIASILG